jgi:ABC-type transporter Mla subunit MlaD
MATILAGAILGFAIFAYIGVHVSRTLFTKTYEARFALSDATGIVPGSQEVRVKGIAAGTITKLSTSSGAPVVTVKIQKKYGRIFRDVRAELRPNTPLQDMYLDILDRGSSRSGELAEDAVVPTSQVDVPVNVADVLNVFRANTRQRLRTLLDQLGNGLSDRGASLRAAFAQAVPLLKVAGNVSHQVAVRSDLTKRLVHNSSLLTAELAGRDHELRTLVHDGSATLTTLQQGSRDLSSLLAELPPTLREVHSSFAAVRGVTDEVDTALRSLYPIAGKLDDSLAQVRRLNSDLSPAVRRLRTPVRQLVPLAAQLRPLSAALQDAIETLRGETHTVDRVTRNLANCKKGVQGFFQYDASMVKYGDLRGPVPRGNVVAGAGSASGLIKGGFEGPDKACTPGTAIGGRVPTAEDGH